MSIYVHEFVGSPNDVVTSGQDANFPLSEEPARKGRGCPGTIAIVEPSLVLQLCNQSRSCRIHYKDDEFGDGLFIIGVKPYWHLIWIPSLDLH